MAAMGVAGYNGTRNPPFNSGNLRRRAMRERLTRVNVSKNITLAAEPITCMGNSKAMTSTITPVTAMAICGVRRRA